MPKRSDAPYPEIVSKTEDGTTSQRYEPFALHIVCSSAASRQGCRTRALSKSRSLGPHNDDKTLGADVSVTPYSYTTSGRIGLFQMGDKHRRFAGKGSDEAGMGKA
jgi:hypothetical protein